MTRNKNLPVRILFTALVTAVSLTLANLPAPGINREYLSSLFSAYSMLGYMDTLSGGSLSQLGIAGFGISTYITASIILQLAGILFPSMDRVRRGYHGKKVMERAGLILALCFTFAGGLGLSLTLGDSGLYTSYDALHVSLSIGGWMAGTFLVVVLALMVEDYGIGNGVSLVLCANILSRLPSQVVDAVTSAESPLFSGCVLVAAAFLLYLAVAYLAGGKLPVPIAQNRKQAASYNASPVLPVPVNIANVLPVVYATSLLSLPAMAAEGLGLATEDGILAEVLDAISLTAWYDASRWYDFAGPALYLILLWAFTAFASQMAFNPAEIAENMKKNGDVVPGVAPGEDTRACFELGRRAMVTLSFFFLAAVTLLPDLACAKAGISGISFFGTSMVIVYSVLKDLRMRVSAGRAFAGRRAMIFRERRHSIEENQERTATQD